MTLRPVICHLRSQFVTSSLCTINALTLNIIALLFVLILDNSIFVVRF